MYCEHSSLDIYDVQPLPLSREGGSVVFHDLDADGKVWMQKGAESGWTGRIKLDA